MFSKDKNDRSAAEEQDDLEETQRKREGRQHTGDADVNKADPEKAQEKMVEAERLRDEATNELRGSDQKIGHRSDGRENLAVAGQAAEGESASEYADQSEIPEGDEVTGTGRNG